MTWRARLTQPLTPAQKPQATLALALIPVCIWIGVMWSAYAISNSPPGRLDRGGHVKGSDFIHFYILGQVIADGAPDELYDFEAQSARTDRLVPEYTIRYLPVYGPQVAMLFAPLARLPYVRAVTVWLLTTAAIYALSCYVVWTTLPALGRRGWLVAILAVGYPPFYWLIASGHITVISLLAVVIAYIAMRSGRRVLAGFAFGLLFHKPALAVMLPFVFFYAREWRIVAGAIAAIAAQVSIAWLGVGTHLLWQYIGVVTRLGDAASKLEPGPYQMHSLRSLFSILLPWPTLAFAGYLAAAAVVTWMTARTWMSGASLELRFGVLLLGMMLVDPHVNSYDLVVMAPAFLLLSSWAIDTGAGTPAFWTLLFLSYYLPAFEFIAKVTHIQASVVALTCVLVIVVRRARAADWPGASAQPELAGS